MFRLSHNQVSPVGLMSGDVRFSTYTAALIRNGRKQLTITGIKRTSCPVSSKTITATETVWVTAPQNAAAP